MTSVFLELLLRIQYANLHTAKGLEMAERHGRIRLLVNGNAEVCGEDSDGRLITVISRNLDFIALHLSSSNVWNGRGQPRRYVPAKIRVFAIVEEEVNSQLVVAECIEWDIKRGGK